MISSAHLPDDAALLKALVLAQQAQLAERDAEIERLKLILAKLRRMQFGRRSERLDETIGQLELSLEELEAVRAEGVGQKDAAAPVAAGRCRAKRRARVPCANPCPITCRARPSSTPRPRAAARIAAAP